MKNMSYMNELLRYIEDNLTTPFQINDLASGNYISAMQLYRDFYNTTGHSVKEYIRKRRLSNALAVVKYSDMSLADIAYGYGYSSQQAFCKCVKGATGLTPLEYKHSESHFYFPMFFCENKHQITVATDTMPRTMEIKFYHRQLQGIEHRALEYLVSLLPDYSGRIFGRDGKQEDSQFCYELFIEYHPKAYHILKEVFFQPVKLIPSYPSVFAKTTVKNLDEAISSAWDYLYTDWLKASMFAPSDLPYFEEYLRRDGKTHKLVLYLPVKKRADYNRICLQQCDDMRFLLSRKTGENAEENASKAVLDFLSSHYPFLIRAIKRFYVSKDDMGYTCGITLDKILHLPESCCLETLSLPAGFYAVLEGDCCGDSSVYIRMLMSWLSENGFVRDMAAAPFTLYETDRGFRREHITSKTYILLNHVING